MASWITALIVLGSILLYSSCGDDPDPIALRLLQLQIAKLQVLVSDLETSMADEYNECPCNETLQNLTSSLEMLEEELMRNSPTISPDPEVEYLKSQLQVKYEDCEQLYQDGFTTSGVYQIWLVDFFDFLPVYCDMDVGANRGWMTILRRYNGSESFNVGFEDFKTGFGLPKEEHWIGTDNIYTLTRDSYTSRGGRARLRIDIESVTGVQQYAEYQYFSIGSKTEDFKLNKLSDHSGTAEDELSKSINSTFTNCLEPQGAWWKCNTVASLNAQYGSLSWGSISLRSVSMKLQRYIP